MTATHSTATHVVDLADLVLEPDAIARIPRSLAIRHDVLSIASVGNQITIAVPNPDDRDTIDRVRLVTGMHVHALRANRDAIRARLPEAYPAESVHSARDARSDEAPAIRAVDALHRQAVASGASDVHVEPSLDGGRVRQRVDGLLLETASLPRELYLQTVSRIKLLAGMDIADRRQPQDGRYAIEESGRSIDVRASTMPTIQGEKLVIRLLDPHARIPSLASLGMPERYAERFRRSIHAPHGFIVVCGPTGSGKTTTLYAAMSERNVDSQNLCSVEDPVEVRIPGIAQVQVNVRAGVTFGSALRAFLRQDPNVVMVGEMRDQETAAVAASASLSGQLVMTTLHSNDAARAVDRLVELGVARHTLAAGLTAIVAQRLVRRLCEVCKVQHPVPAAIAAAFGIASGAATFRAAGCNLCAGSGYAGRIAIFEAMFLDETMRTAIASGASSVTLRAMAEERGYHGMLKDGVRRALSGDTSFDELRRVVPVDSPV